MPVLGGTKTITRDEIIDPEPNVKEIFFAQLILRQAPSELEFSTSSPARDLPSANVTSKAEPLTERVYRCVG